MAIIDLFAPAFRQHFIDPIQKLVSSSSKVRSCDDLSDCDFVAFNVARTLGLEQSGRGYLQTMMSVSVEGNVPRSTYFDALASDRRADLVADVARAGASQTDAMLPDRLGYMKSWLTDFAVYAGDGHWHGAACHDKLFSADGKKIAMGHLFAINLRTGSARHIVECDQVERRKEHDMRALKRMPHASLRFGHATKTKVILVWDRAGIDFRQWFNWKHAAGLYIISRDKENMRLEPTGNLAFDASLPVNAGVIADELAMPSSAGVAIRRVRFRDPVTGEEYAFLTLEMTLPPGIIAELYRRRWDIEKCFDTFKSVYAEQKAWASSPQAKATQANIMCLAHNLVLRLEEHLRKVHSVENTAENERRRARNSAVRALPSNKAPQQAATPSSALPLKGTKSQAPSSTPRKSAASPEAPPWGRDAYPFATKICVKLARWIRVMMRSHRPWEDQLAVLQAMYAEL